MSPECDDAALDVLRAEFPGWTITTRRFADGWNLCAWQHGTSTTGRVPDITRRTEDELRDAITAVTTGARL